MSIVEAIDGLDAACEWLLLLDDWSVDRCEFVELLVHDQVCVLVVYDLQPLTLILIYVQDMGIERFFRIVLDFSCKEG